MTADDLDREWAVYDGSFEARWLTLDVRVRALGRLLLRPIERLLEWLVR